MIVILLNSSVVSIVVMKICRLVFGLLKLVWACYAVGEKRLAEGDRVFFEVFHGLVSFH